MDKDEIIMISIMIAGAILAIPVMFAIWTPMKRKLEKYRLGKILLGITTHRGGKLVFCGYFGLGNKYVDYVFYLGNFNIVICFLNILGNCVQLYHETDHLYHFN